jgi:hypothetical protein
MEPLFDDELTLEDLIHLMHMIKFQSECYKSMGFEIDENL